MTARELRRILRSLGCVEVRQKGSHLLVRCGTCTTIVPVHAGDSIGPGLLRVVVGSARALYRKRMAEVMKKAKSYRVVFERDEAGYWVVSAPDVPGCATQGKSLASARSRIREALSLFVSNAATAQLSEEVRVPGIAQNVTALSESWRGVEENARRAVAAAQSERATLLKRLEKAGVGRRDSAELVGLSAQRVQQVIDGSTPRKAG